MEIFEKIQRIFSDTKRTEKYLKDIEKICSFPTVSSWEKKDPMFNCSEWIIERMKKAGINAFALSENGGFPFIYGSAEGKSEKTVLFYNHYDVVPPGNEEKWITNNPFKPEIIDNKLIARGVADNKGNILARIHAIELLKELNGGELPVNVKFIIDPQEEVGSPGLREFLKTNKSKLKADICVWEGSQKDSKGNPTVQLGNKGICCLELTLKTLNNDINSSQASLYPNAIWRLIKALSILKDSRGNIKVPGFFENVRALSTEEKEAISELKFDIKDNLEKAGIERFLPGNEPMDINKALYFEPTINIQGIFGGYTGEGIKGIIPSYAFARLDCRLVKDQDPKDILRKISNFLSEEGFEDINVKYLMGLKPQFTPIDHPVVKLVKDSCWKVYNKPIVLIPSSPGAGPRGIFDDIFNIPIIGLGVANSKSNTHSINENILINDYLLGVGHMAVFLKLFGEN